MSVLPEIVNIVSLWNIDPLEIKVDNSKRQKRFNAQVIRRDQGVFLVWASGKVIATGFKNVALPGSLLQEIYPDRVIRFVKVVNITAHAFIPYSFNIPLLIETFAGKYEPEIYPAIYIKINYVTLIYYSTGSVLITGAKTEQQINDAHAQFIERSLPVRKV